ncbi:MAG: hypothetical protein RLZZ440_699, partial [Planctomycetota bacterium]
LNPQPIAHFAKPHDQPSAYSNPDECGETIPKADACPMSPLCRGAAG